MDVQTRHVDDRGRRSDRGSVLVITLVLVTICATMVVGSLTYVQTNLKSNPVIVQRSTVTEAASSAMRAAILMQSSEGPAGCIDPSSLPNGSLDTSDIPVDVQCTVLESVDNGRGRLAVISTQTDTARRGLQGYAGAGGDRKDVDGGVFLNGGDVTNYTSDVLVRGTNQNGFRIEYSNSTAAAPGASPSTTPTAARYRVGATTVGCDGAAALTSGYPKGTSTIDGGTYTYRTPACTTSTNLPLSNNVPWWQRAGDDPDPLDGVAEWVYPRLPVKPKYDRDGKFVDLTSSCRMYYPGFYDNSLTLDGTSGREFYFASGIYQFDAPLIVQNGAKVVFGSGRVPGCAVDSDLALAPQALSNHSITGKGATILLDKAGRVEVRSSSFSVNRRISTPATRGSEGVAIRTVNMGTSTAYVQVPRDKVQVGEYPCVESAPTVCATPTELDTRSTANTVDIGSHTVTLPTKPNPTNLSYSGSTLAHTDNAVLYDVTTSPSQAASNFEVDGYIFTPNAQFQLKGAAAGASASAYSFFVNGGVAASRVLLDAKTLPATPADNWYVGVAAQSVQLRVALTATATPADGPSAVSRAIVEVRSDGSYAINSWVVEYGDEGEAPVTTTTTLAPTTTAAPTTTTTLPCPTITGWRGQYYNSDDLSGSPVLCRNDASIAFDWGSGSPGGSVGVDGFSVRWSKTQSFTTGTYRFTWGADDGIRVLVDGDVVADCWCERAYTTGTVDVPIAAGDHTITVEYKDASGTARVNVSFVSVSTTTTTSTTIATTTTTTIPGVTCPNPITGWKAEYFNGKTLSGNRILCGDVAKIDFNWGNGSPGPGMNSDGFSARFTRTITATAGTYRFNIGGDDGTRLYIDGVLVHNDWVSHSYKASGVDVPLTAGSHTIVLEYFEDTNPAAVYMTYSLVADECPSTVTGWKGEYYTTTDLSGARIVCRDDAALNTTSITKPVVPGVYGDAWSARWTKVDTFDDDTYRFTLGADDGIILFVDGVQKYSRWQSGLYYETTVDIPMTAGQHTIVVRYYDGGGSAGIKVSWASASVPCPTVSGWKGEYYNTKTLTGPRVLCRDDAAINFNWGTGSPAVGVNGEFSARWTRSINFAAGRHRFTIGSDDGYRLKIDGVQVSADWTSHLYRTAYVDVTLSAGPHTVVLEYYDEFGTAQIDLTYEQVTCPTITGWQAEYYANNSLTGDYTICRNEPSPNANWGNGSPHSYVPTDNFSVRYTRTENFAAGIYRFVLGADDGIRMYIDGNLVFDRWSGSGYAQQSVDRALTAGSHTIVVEYREIWSTARIDVAYAIAPCSNVTGWRGEYYTNTNGTGTPICRGDATINFNWGGGSPMGGIPADGFGVRWTKDITFTAGSYRFRTVADDAARLYVDGVLQGERYGTGTYDVTLTAGVHSIRVEYGEAAGNASVNFSWTPLVRYVRVQLPGTAMLNMAEVQIQAFDQSGNSSNVALFKTASQSSTYSVLLNSGTANKAVDNNTAGSFSGFLGLSGSVQATNSQSQPWWEVDLGANYGINQIIIYNRTDANTSALNNARVFISPSAMTSQSYATLVADTGLFTKVVSPLNGTQPAWTGSYSTNN